MTQYRVEFDRKAEKQLEAIRVKRTVLALRGAILALPADPRLVGVVKLAGAADMWRIGVGDWRVIYRIDDGELVVLVVAFGVRGGVYL